MKGEKDSFSDARVKLLEEECNVCGRQLNSWDARISKVLAYKYPCCEGCIAKEYDYMENELRAHFEHYFGFRPCQGI